MTALLITFTTSTSAVNVTLSGATLGRRKGVLNAFDTAAARHPGGLPDGDVRYSGWTRVFTNGDASMVTTAGSIVDARNGGAGDAAANVIATTVDLDANGAGRAWAIPPASTT